MTKKTWTVYVPCIYSEVYRVEAESAEEALRLVKNGEAQCLGEHSTGREEEGFRVIEEKPRSKK